MLARARPGRRSPVPVLSFVAVSGYRGGLIAIKGARLDLVALTCELHLVRSRRLRTSQAAPVTPVLDGQQPSALTNFQGQVAQLFLHGLLRCLLYTSPSPRDRTRSRMP